MQLSRPANGKVVPGKEVWRIRPSPSFGLVGSSLELGCSAGLFIGGTQVRVSHYAHLIAIHVAPSVLGEAGGL